MHDRRVSGDSSSARDRMRRLASFVARAPSPMAWVELCADLSEWPEQEIARAIEFLRPRLSEWPRDVRTAPEWWRIAWEEGRDEPRLALAPALAGPLLPARGGGSHPVQYDVVFEDRSYYVRYRSGCLSVTLERVGGRGVDRELIELMPDCLADDDRWTDEETHALLSLISAALRRYQLSRLRLPRTRAELRDSPFFMRGPYPLYCQKGPCGDPEHAHDERCYDTLQAANRRLARDAERFPDVAAARHHLSLVRPGHVGPWPRYPGRAEWIDELTATRVVTRCDVTVSRRLRAHQDVIWVCEFLPDGRLLTGSEDHTLRVWSLESGESFALRGHSEEVTCCARLPNGRVVSGSDDGTLRVWSLRRGGCDQVLRGHPLPVGQVVAVGSDLVSSDQGGLALYWNLATGARASLSEGTGRPRRLVALSEDRVALGNGVITVWSKTRGDVCTLR